MQARFSNLAINTQQLAVRGYDVRDRAIYRTSQMHNNARRFGRVHRRIALLRTGLPPNLKLDRTEFAEMPYLRNAIDWFVI